MLVLDSGGVVIAGRDAQGSGPGLFQFERYGDAWMHFPGATKESREKMDSTYTEPLGTAALRPLTHTPSRLETEAPKVARKAGGLLWIAIVGVIGLVVLLTMLGEITALAWLGIEGARSGEWLWVVVVAGIFWIVGMLIYTGIQQEKDKEK